MPSPAIDQINLTFKSLNNKKLRAKFLANPAKFAQSQGVELDKGFVKVLENEIRMYKGQIKELQGYGIKITNKILEDPTMGMSAKTIFEENEVAALPAVMAVAAVVSAAAAVVSAASVTYAVTKW